jgi:hypothetical protein
VDETADADADAGAYLTNEAFLYRLAGPLPSGDAVEVEDCYSLDVVRVPVRNVHERGLRVVTPAAARSGETTPFESRQERSRIASISPAAAWPPKA